MQIPSNNIGIQQSIQVNTTPERVVRGEARGRGNTVEQPQAAVQNPEVDLQAEFQRRVSLSQVIAESRRAGDVDQSLPRSTQQALRAFEQARPSVEQQLGIEIVGIDTFA